jgi:hypothetical protein
MKLWQWIVIGAAILTLCTITGFWQHLFNQIQVPPIVAGPGGRGWVPTAKAYSYGDD